MDTQIQQAVNILKQGGIVIFPTDTAFGIGCRIDDEKAVARLFEIRKRPESKATPVLVNSIEMVKEYVDVVPKDVEDKLIKKYWPGALTIVLQCKIDKVPDLVRGGGNTLGLRFPNHPTVRNLITEVGVPILGPSANFHKEKTPYEFGDLDLNLVNLVDFVLNGECTIKQASTVIDCTQIPWSIIREGAVKISL